MKVHNLLSCCINFATDCSFKVISRNCYLHPWILLHKSTRFSATWMKKNVLYMSLHGSLNLTIQKLASCHLKKKSVYILFKCPQSCKILYIPSLFKLCPLTCNLNGESFWYIANTFSDGNPIKERNHKII